jgi:hypothetical protein
MIFNPTRRRAATSSEIPDRNRSAFSEAALLISMLVLAASSVAGIVPQRASEEIDDITGKYHFLSADDNLALLDEEGKLHGYIDVYQGEEESDTVLSYAITSGMRQGSHVEFKTSKIHQKYYRFTGSVQRGAGQREADPDYLRLIGDLEIVTMKAESGAETVERMHVVFKSLGKEEAEQQ